MKPISKNVSVLALALVAVSISGTFALADDFQGAQLEKQTGGIYGHLEAKVIDENGNVKQYVQSDNRIVVRGTDMLVTNTLVPSGAWTGTINSTVAPVTHMQIGTSSAADTSTTAALLGAVAGCNPVTFTADSAAGADSGGFAETQPTLSATFSGAAPCNTTFNEAGLFDDVAGSGVTSMFARGVFSTGVTLATTDSLDVDWTFTFTDT